MSSLFGSNKNAGKRMPGFNPAADNGGQGGGPVSDLFQKAEYDGSGERLAAIRDMMSGVPEMAYGSGSPLLQVLAPIAQGLVTKGAMNRTDKAEEALAERMRQQELADEKRKVQQKRDYWDYRFDRKNEYKDNKAEKARAARQERAGALVDSMSGGGLSGSQRDRAAKIRAGLLDRGIPEHVADGFVVNMIDESGLKPGINERNPIVEGSRGGFGLYQLTGPRRTAYEAFAKDRGVALDDIDAQLDFLVQELRGSESQAAKSIFKTSTREEAAAAIVNDFLRPSEKYRKQRAQKYLSGNIPDFTSPADQEIRQQLVSIMMDPDAPAQARGMAQDRLEAQMGGQDGSLSDEDKTASIRTLERRAKAGGLEPGTPEYQNFMLRGGSDDSLPSGRQRFTPAQVNRASELIMDTRENLTANGYTREEALKMAREDPALAYAWKVIQSAEAGPSREKAASKSQETATNAPPPPPGTVPF